MRGRRNLGIDRKLPNILGVHAGHDAAAALVIDGRVVACVAEERFRRVKHYAGLPLEAIDYCLGAGGLSADDLDEVALTSATSDGGLLRHLMRLGPGPRPAATPLRQRPRAALRSVLESLRATPPVTEGPPLYVPRWIGSRTIPVRAVEHHVAHAASAYYGSGGAASLVFTADGVGDDCSLAVWRVTPPAQFECLYRVGTDGSLGWFYAVVTEALGWWTGDGEGKTMGLAPYGSTAGIEGILDDYCPSFRDGRLSRGHRFTWPLFWPDAGTHHWHFPEAEQVAKLVARHGREAIAAEAQRVLEREMIALVAHWLDEQQARAACFAGGVMLNVKMNQRIWESGVLDTQYIFPEAGDAGLAAGAALLGSAARGGPIATEPIADVYWGPAFDDEQVRAVLDERRLSYTRVADPAVAAAELLAQGRIVGWFQGRMEAGPRALGHRSILMDPGTASNKDVINARVKFREGFRPFCPSMTPRAAAELLAPGARDERFMITSFDVTPAARTRIPAVVHVDGTARPQLIRREDNPSYYRVLEEYRAITGIPSLINTSFNIHEEPIVNTPSEAIKAFRSSELDALILGDRLVIAHEMAVERAV